MQTSYQNKIQLKQTPGMNSEIQTTHPLVCNMNTKNLFHKSNQSRWLCVRVCVFVCVCVHTCDRQRLHLSAWTSLSLPGKDLVQTHLSSSCREETPVYCINPGLWDNMEDFKGVPLTTLSTRALSLPSNENKVEIQRTSGDYWRNKDGPKKMGTSAT